MFVERSVGVDYDAALRVGIHTTSAFDIDVVAHFVV